jgi:ATP-dependent helicase/DNAse subunit B
MRILLGPPGSGKTTNILTEFCSNARSGPALLIVPTATMARHIQHELARRAEPIPPSWITTFSRFASSLAPGLETADSSALALLAARELELRPHLYSQLRDAPGLPAAIAAAIEELANSGCGALQWTTLSGFGRRFDPQLGEIYEAIEQALAQAGLHLRAQLLQEAARRVRSGDAHLPPLWFDGFTQFSGTELALIHALRENTHLTLSLPEWEGAAPVVEHFQRARVERLQSRRPAPRISLIPALSRERECEEIALRLVEEHRRGRPWREMAVILRSEEQYLALLERTLARLGIPFHAYFGRSVLREPAGIFFQRFAAAVVSEWDGETTLEFLRHPLCRSAARVRGKTWIEALENLPFRGLKELRQNTCAAADVLAPFESWPFDLCSPAEWARRLPHVAALLDPPPASGVLSESQLRDFRLRSSVFRDFWSALKDALEESRVYPGDPRRDVVHILDVEEARQWELPVVFVCGLLEGEFPRRSSPDPVLSDDLRLALRQHGFPVRIRADFETLERFHFDIACSRATGQLFLSWPERNEKGEANLRSFFLDVLDLERTPKLPARRFLIRPPRLGAPAPRPALQSDEALHAVRAIRSSLRATAVESYLQCPFQFFARSILELNPLPPLPSERLDAPFLGSLAHEILAEWHRRGGSIETITDEIWDRRLRHYGLQETHQTVLDRAAMKRCLAAYAAGSLPGTDWQVLLETDLSLSVSNVEIRGRADRVDVSAGGACRVYDFKYSRADSIRSRQDISVQLELYAEALSRSEGLRPAALHYVALKDQSKLIGPADPQEAQESIAAALEKTRAAIEHFQSGRIEVRPAVEDLCGYCEFRNACRCQEEAAAAAAGGGQAG